VGGAASGSRARRRAAGGVTAGAMVARVGWVPFACVIGALVLVAGSALTWNGSPYWGRNGDQLRPAAAAAPPLRGLHTLSRSVQLRPVRIAIPKLHTAAPVVKVGTTSSGELDIPLNPKTVGWWSPGAKPGARAGTAILAGHINYSGVTGALAEIGKLRRGDRVLLFGRHHSKRAELTLRITGVRTYHKTHLPYRQIFAQHVAGRVALVTCGGPFDAATGNYLDNIVAFAVPAHAKL
jgi:hypothetical protein